MKAINEIRLITISVLVFLSLVFLAYPLIAKKSGVVVTGVSKDSTCKEILTYNSVVTKINEKDVTNSASFYSSVKDLKGKISLIVNGGPRVCDIGNNQTIDVRVKNFENDGIRLGIDIGGGRKFIIESDSVDAEMEKIASRGKIYGLTDLEISKDSDKSFNIIFDSSEEDKIENILQPGVVSVKFMEIAEIKNNTGKILLNDKAYNFTIDEGVMIYNKNYDVGDKFSLDSVEIEVQNITENYTSFFLDVFDDNDVNVSSLSKNIGLTQSGKVFQYGLIVDLSVKAQENFKKVTKGQPIMVNPQGENFLEGPLVVLVDGEIFTSVPVTQADAGKDLERVILWGVENTKEEASRKLQVLTAFLESGRLADIRVAQRLDVQPERKALLNLAAYAVLGLAIASCAYGFLRFKSVKITGLILGVFATEVLLVLGLVSSRVFAMILLVFCMIFAFIKSGGKGWIKWVVVVLMILISFPSAVNKVVVDSYILLGFGFGTLITAVQFILLKTDRREEKIFRYFWEINLAILILMAVLFFIPPYRNISIASGVMVMIGLSLTKPEFMNMAKKIKKG